MVTHGDIAFLKKLNGATIPLVKSYQYLGIEFTSTLTVDHMVGQRFLASRRMVTRLTPFLRSSVIPMHLRYPVCCMVVKFTV